MKGIAGAQSPLDGVCLRGEATNTETHAHTHLYMCFMTPDAVDRS